MKIKVILVSVVLSAFAFQLNAQKTITDTLSYAMGQQIAESFKQMKMLGVIDRKVFNEAIDDVINGVAVMTQEQCQAKITSFLEGQTNGLKTENLAEGQAFLEKNKTQKGIVALPSGLQYKIERKGNGVKPTATDEVEVHYKGTTLNGTVFDSSYDRNETVTFPLNRVIKGWTEGLQLVDEGGKIQLYIPAKLAYGENGVPNTVIEPNSVLVFEVELIKVIKKAPEALIQPKPIAAPAK